jgi:predicted RNase H-like HicB family nuclease
MKYIVLIHKENDSCWGECPELPGCYSQGNTPEDLMENMKEAIGLYLDEAAPEERLPVIHEVRELVV